MFKKVSTRTIIIWISILYYFRKWVFLIVCVFLYDRIPPFFSSIVFTSASGSGSEFALCAIRRVSTRKNQLLQNQILSNVACTPTCKNLLVQISESIQQFFRSCKKQLGYTSMYRRTLINSVIQSSNWETHLLRRHSNVSMQWRRVLAMVQREVEGTLYAFTSTF